jgi:hypothetical protein
MPQITARPAACQEGIENKTNEIPPFDGPFDKADGIPVSFNV